MSGDDSMIVWPLNAVSLFDQNGASYISWRLRIGASSGGLRRGLRRRLSLFERVGVSTLQPLTPRCAVCFQCTSDPWSSAGKCCLRYGAWFRCGNGKWVA